MMIRLGPPDINDDDRRAVDEVLRSGWLVNGPMVTRFEEAVAQYVGAKAGVAVSSGTAALIVALRAHNIGAGDQVLVPAFTFPATAHAVMLVGAEPILVDIDSRYWNIDPEQAAAALTLKTKAILAVDQFGLPADRNALSALTKANGEKPLLIEDSACALGASFQGIRCGAGHSLSCFSFHPRKVITSGEGGMICTDDLQLAARMRALRNLGRQDDGGFGEAAGNLRLNEMAAALGLSQIGRIDDMLQKRRDLAKGYCSRLEGDSRFSWQHIPKDTQHTWQTFALSLAAGIDRDGIIKAMAAAGVEAAIATYGLHRERPYDQDPRWTAEALPNAEHMAKQGIALPLHLGLDDASLDQIVAAFLSALAKG